MDSTGITTDKGSVRQLEKLGGFVDRPDRAGHSRPPSNHLVPAREYETQDEGSDSRWEGRRCLKCRSGRACV